jgi:uncharacterized protein (TIGR00369 family)
VTEPAAPAKLQARLDASPFSKFLGLKLIDADAGAGSVVILMPMRPELERLPGTGQFHGGAIASLIDIAGDFALILGVGDAVPTINYRVDYLRPATGREIRARAVVRRAGRTVAVVDIEVHDAEQRLIAIGRGCYATTPG